MKKNKKGFTLVELLAVIIIIILVLLIAINKTRQSSKEARKNAIRANALSLIKAVNNQAGLDVLGSKIFKNSVFNVYGLEQNGVKLSGTKPSNALVCVVDYELDNACLEYNGYKVIYNENSIKSIKRGTCSYNDFKCEVKPTYFIDFTGSYQAYTAPRTGTYKIDLWGAQGGSTSNAEGGKGAYTSGILSLTEGDTIYFYVGGQGSARSSSDPAGAITGGWNGGGAGNKNRTNYNQANSAGGGATDVRLVAGDWNDAQSLNSRIMVAAGGGGSYESDNVFINGGAGGALKGESGVYLTDTRGYSNINPKGGTQTTGGAGINDWNHTSYSDWYLGLFGVGGTGTNSYGGGGGGYWGGASGNWQPGAGGSSYISGYNGCVAITSISSNAPKSGCNNGTKDIACSYHYSNLIFARPVMKSGNELMPNHDNTSTMTGNEGNGYAVIYENYYLEDASGGYDYSSYEYAYTGHEEVFTAPERGKYKLEVWGAQGGGSIKNAVSNPSSSYGGYSIGYVSLNAGDKLYVNVGGKGTDAIVGQDVAGGYNGGGIGTWDHNDNEAAGGGGGATHIATETGLLSTLSAKVNSILIVAGGAGGKSWSTDGGNGGGYVALPSGDGRAANQLSGYQFGKGQDAVGTGDSNGHGGGGGGFYGGYESSSNDEDADFGGGGSGYIGNSSLYDKMMYCYGCEQQLSDTRTFTVNTAGNSAYIDSNLCPLGYSSNPVSKCAKSGDGFAKITFVE